MENASKALLIAGAILICIMLISVGLMVLQSAYGIFDSSKESMSAQEIRLFNSEFENYSGTQRGSNVKSLMSAISASNVSHDEDHQVTVTYEGSESTTDTISSSVRSTSSYEVKITTNEKSGLITTIDVSRSSSSN